MSSQNYLCRLGLIIGVFAASPLLAQSGAFSVSCPSPVAPGTDVFCTVSLAPTATSVTSLAFGIQISPNGQAPDLDPNGAVNWDGGGQLPPANLNGNSNLKKSSGGNFLPASSGGGYNDLAVSFSVTGNGVTITGFPVIGYFDWIVPASAQANQTYSLTFTSGLANNGNTAIATTTAGGTVSVIGQVTITSPTVAALAPQADIGTAYTQTFTASGGNGTYNWTINNGSLPGGLSFTSANNQGTISGTPSAGTAGTFNNIVITVTDTETTPETAQMTYSLQVNNGLGSLSPATLPNGAMGSAYSQVVSLSGGSPNYTWTVTGLPTGLSIGTNVTALGQITISGTPTGTATNAPISVQVTDADGATQSANYTLTISGPLSLSPATGSTLSTATVGKSYSTAFTASGGAGPYTFLLMNAPASSNLTGSANGATFTVSGIPGVASAGAYTNVMVKVTDSEGTPVIVTNTYNLTIDSAIIVTAPTTLPNGTQGAPYNGGTAIASTATGGNGSFTWTLSSVPAGIGLSINSGTGAITGPATGAGTFAVTVTATDTNGATGSITINNVLISAGVVINSPATGALHNGTIGITYVAPNGITLTTSGGTTPFTWSLAATTLPAGLSLNTATFGTSTTITGIPTGTPPVAGTTTNFTVQVTDNTGSTNSVNYSITVFPAPTLTAPAALSTATVGTAYTNAAPNAYVASGGAPNLTWSILSGLPANSGITINSSTGAITGTPAVGTNTNTGPTTANTPDQIKVQVTDNNGATANATAPLTIDIPVTISTTSPLPSGTTSGAYLPGGNTLTLAAAGGNGTYTWTVNNNSLPAGLSLNASTGAITGTPTAAGAFNAISITVSDSTGASSGPKIFSMTINGPLSITTVSPLPAATLNAPYTTNVVSTGGTANYTWSETGQPTGLNIAGTGATGATATLSGTPTVNNANPYIVVAKVTDASGAFVTANLSLTVNAAPSLAGSMATATVGNAYTTLVANVNSITETGGTAPLTYSITSGLTTNPGLTINASTGVISGTPTTAGTLSVVVKVVDANTASATQTYSFIVNPAITLTPSTLTIGTPGVHYTTVNFAGGGGAGGPYTFTSTGFTNTGLTLSGAGVLSGTIAANAVTTPVTITVTDSASVSHTFNLTLSVAGPLSITGPASLPGGIVNQNYAGATIVATGGTTPYAWSATGLPAGLTIGAASGAISGTPTTTVGSPFNVTVKVTDQNNTQVTANYVISVGATPLSITTGTLPAGVVNLPYTYTHITANGGVGSYNWTVTGLPAGLQTDGNGDIFGTPTTATGSPFSVVVTVTDSTGTSAKLTYSLVIAAPLSVAAPATLPAAALNNPYAPVTVTASGGLPPYTWAATGLPAGMTIAQVGGVISGTPTVATGSPYPVTVTVEDSTGKTASIAYSLTVNSPLTVTGPASLPLGTVGTAYTSTTITASGGTGTYTWSATGLPTGLAISSAGAITGTPSGAAGGSYTVVVTVTDSASNTATKSYPLTINSLSSVPTLTGATAATEGQALIGPNTWVSIYGTNFASTGFTDTWSNELKAAPNTLPTMLDNVTVNIGGMAAYVSFISATQINVLAPNIGLGPVQVTVTTPAGTSNAVTVTSQQDVPGFFEFPNNQPIATHLNYTDAAAAGTFPGVTTVPAAPGETILLWGSGFGTTSPSFPYGVPIPSTPTFMTAFNVSATLNSAPITVIQNQAFLTAGAAGLFQVAVTIPTPLANGSYPLIVTINGISSPALMLTVQN